jgi:hypothetical protein
MNWLQIRLFGPYFSSFSTNSYGYYSQMSQNLFSSGLIFASALMLLGIFRKQGKAIIIFRDSTTKKGSRLAALLTLYVTCI